MSLTPIAAMVFTFIMVKWVDEAIQGGIDATQFGGISGSSTTHVHVEMVHFHHIGHYTLHMHSHVNCLAQLIPQMLYMIKFRLACWSFSSRDLILISCLRCHAIPIIIIILATRTDTRTHARTHACTHICIHIIALIHGPSSKNSCLRHWLVWTLDSQCAPSLLNFSHSHCVVVSLWPRTQDISYVYV